MREVRSFLLAEGCDGESVYLSGLALNKLSMSAIVKVRRWYVGIVARNINLEKNGDDDLPWPKLLVFTDGGEGLASCQG